MDAEGAFGQALPAGELSAKEPFATRLSRRDDVVWLALGGELDVFTAPVLRTALREAGLRPGDRLVLDLRGVAFMDSSGLAVILGAHERALNEERPPVRIAIKGSEAIESLFRTIGASEFLHLIDGPADLQAAGQRG